AHLNIILESWRYTSDRVIKNHKAILYLAVFITLLLASFVTPYLCLGVALLYLIAIHFTGIRPFSDGKKGWHWDKIVAVEQDRQQQIKRGLALFVNMPQDAVSSKRRKYLDGTGSLSVTREYLALGDGPPGFRRNYTCSAVLRIQTSVIDLSSTGLSPSVIGLPMPFD